MAPIFFLLIFAGIEFATIGTIRSTSHNAAYEAARKIVIPGADANDASTEAKRIMAIVGVNSMTVTVTPSVITNETQEVTVALSVPYSENAVFTPWFAGDVVLQSSITMKTERNDGVLVP